MTKNERVYRFKHVCGGRPIAESELPKLPVSAMAAVYRMTAAYNRLISSTDFSAEDGRVVFEASVEISYLVLKRLDPALTLATLNEDEDLSEVRGVYEAIRAANPDVFAPPKEAPTEEAMNPLDERRSPSEPSES